MRRKCRRKKFFCPRRRRRRFSERVEAEINNVIKAGPVSGEDNKIEQEIENNGSATVINRSKDTSQTNNNED